MDTRTPPPAYQPLSRPEGATDRLVTFITDRLTPAMEDIAASQEGAVHKLDFLRVGQKAGALRSEASRWLAEAERLLTVAYADQMEAVHDAEPERIADGGARRSAEALKARAKERVATLQKAADVLRYARDDLQSTLMFVQAALRSVRDEEFAVMGEDRLGAPEPAA